MARVPAAVGAAGDHPREGGLMNDPFKIDGPATIAVSGGRTSGLMLRRIMDAHGGLLPPDVVAGFANTGKERPETLDFVRNGEPFSALIDKKRYLPNGVTRFCTIELKIRIQVKFAQSI